MREDLHNIEIIYYIYYIIYIIYNFKKKFAPSAGLHENGFQLIVIVTIVTLPHITNWFHFHVSVMSIL